METKNESVYQLPEIMERLGTPTLKAVALVFGLQAVRIYSVAKTPKEGEIYDAKVYNWEAVERFCIRRLDPDKGLATLEDVIMKALEIDKELITSDKRRRSEPAGSANIATILVDGRDMPVRKFGLFEMDYLNTPLNADNPDSIPAAVHPAGVHFVMLRKDSNVYGFVYQTRGYTVLQPVGADGNWSSETPKLISNNLLNLYGLGPSYYTLEEVQKRYKEQAALAAAAAESAPASDEPDQE